jgi:uncharacterized protein YfdQ (DUF2303 family)
MSMDKTAIQHIQETANIPALIKSVSDHETEVPVIIVPDSMCVQSLEKYMPTRSRYRLGFSTTSLSDFINYNELHDEEGATCFVDAERMKAKTIFDLGTTEYPQHQEHTATLQLKRIAAFSAICLINGTHLKQSQAKDFIEDWSDYIRATSTEGVSMSAHEAAKALQDITIATAREVNNKVQDFGASMNAMEQIEAKNKAALPAEIEFMCKPYLGLQHRTFILRVSIITSEEKPKIVFRISQLESINEELAEEFKEVLAEASKTLNLKTFIGQV